MNYKEIAKLNDKFRQSGLYSVTQGVFGLIDMRGLVEAIRTFSDFNEDNDPDGEHNFGSLEWKGDTVFWKIDYYDKELYGYCDPLSQDCQRVLTVCLSIEY